MTECIVEMEFVDLTAKEDSKASSSNNQSFGQLNILKGTTNQKDYGTLETNQFVLDGTKAIMPDAPKDVAYWSSEKSKEDCSFEATPKVVISFSKKHTSAGITLTFADEYPAEINVVWKTATGTALMTKTFYPDNLEFYCKQQVQNYEQIEIEFVRTLFPNRYIKLQKVIYGTHMLWDEETIKSATIQEDLDVTSETLPINEADISIVDAAGEFDMSNITGNWKSVQKTQRVTVKEKLNGVDIPMGVFFVDDFSSENNISTFSLIDTIGLMDKYTFYEGKIYYGEPAENILNQIFSASGIADYEIEDEVKNIPLTGYLAIQSCREALRQVCFACGAVADDSRTGIIRVYKPDRYSSGIIGPDRKFNGSTKISQGEYISGVSIECSNYTLEGELSEAFKGTLYSAETRIAFSEPYLPESLTISSGKIKVAKTNYVVVEAAGECVVKGKKYASSTWSVEKRTELVQGEVENIKEFSGCTLYYRIDDVAEALLKHFLLRKKVEMKYLLEKERAGNWVSIRDVKGHMSSSLIESQSIDLTGGFISQATCTGYITETDVRHYAGEIFLGSQWKGL